ncbi:MarR family transcriptional regulator [Planotetraspora thailandica]|uniref:MarR family transcriptional regulator n=1 Tax=Planotetraspora thailandica TaxID=487172 RepID=A0A8J3UWX5_9ACTN|nr:MarR family transcriptional regulator [Planotetraspora thailandica]GII52180.1 MarR family transcriptional regulator [Planotetraspora thailandica]
MGATDLQPLSPLEEAAWRALARALIVLPRALDADLVHAQRMTINEYGVLTNLSEAPGRRLRMSELASGRNLTPAGMTRLVDRLVAEGLVERTKCAEDGRVSFAVLTDAGFQRLEEAYPSHLASVRARVMEHVGPDEMAVLHRIMFKITQAAEGCPAKDS